MTRTSRSAKREKMREGKIKMKKRRTRRQEKQDQNKNRTENPRKIENFPCFLSSLQEKELRLAVPRMGFTV